MIEIKRILCPVDFSDFSRHALRHAIALARWYKADLTALHACHLQIPPVVAGGYPAALNTPPVMGPPAELRDQAMTQFTRFAEGVDVSGVRFVFRVELAAPVHTILDAATSLPADLIVMGTHGHGGLDRLVLGSVTEKVLRKASCPVLTVPPPVTDVTEAPILVQRILCPVDFSESSVAALTYAVSLASESDARLVLMHVIDKLPRWDPQTYTRFDVDGYEQALAEDIRGRLQAAVPEEARSWCRPEELVSIGKPYQEILRVAREKEAHLIVMGVQGRNPIDLMLFGSTTHHVVREAPCPVLTLRG